MATQLNFRADRVTFRTPAADNVVGRNSTLTQTAPTAAPVADAINNVRFDCSGFAGHGGFETVLFTLETRHLFRFRPAAAGRLVGVHTHFVPQGAYRLTARRPTGWFDGPGFAKLILGMRMRCRVVASNREVLLDRFTPSAEVLETTVQAGNRARSAVGSIDPVILEHRRSLDLALPVFPSDTIEVEARYFLQLSANDGADFLLDFSSIPAAGGEPGDGLNVPLAVVHIAT